MQRPLDLLHAAQDLLRRESPPLVVLVHHDVHEGVLLGVDHGPEDVVPEGEGEGPVSAELGLHSTLHGGRPVVDAHLGRRRVSRSSSRRRRVPVFGGRLGVLDVRAGGAVLEAEAEGRGEVERLELVHEDVAGAHLQGLAACFVRRAQLVFQIVQGSRGHGVLVLAVLAAAFRDHASGALVGEDLPCSLDVRFAAVAGRGRLLGLQLVARFVLLVDAVDDLEDLWRDPFLRQPCRGPAHRPLVAVLEGGVS